MGATVEGNIEAFLADVGDEVFQGQVLARIGAAGLESDREAAADAVEYAQDQVGKAEAGVNSARLEASRADADEPALAHAAGSGRQVYDRQKTLHTAGATPQVFEKAQRDYEAA